MEEILDGLNSAQRDAVTQTEGFVRVIAGAGSGKTRVIARRFAYLVNALGVLPSHILCVTFTNKAAAEMKARIRRIAGGNDGGYIATFHSFCVSVLQEDANAVGYPKSFVVLDNGDIDAMLRIIYEERSLTLRDRTFGDARDMFEIRKTQRERDYYKNLTALSLSALKEKYDSATETDDILFYGYLYQQKKTFALDYNDLIVFVLHIFAVNAEIRRKWQERLEYIMIDEFQDIDDIQYRLMEALCAYHQNLFVVGDPDQTIYTWRGANIRYLLDFDRKFPGTRTILMNENFRSSAPILAAANSLIGKNQNRMEKNLSAASGAAATPPPLYHHARRQSDEAAWICDRIEELCGRSGESGGNAGGARSYANDSGNAGGGTNDSGGAGSADYADSAGGGTNDNGADSAGNSNAAAKSGRGGQRAKFSDCAVLYRAHYVSRTLEEVLASRKIPFTLYSGVQFFDREEVKDALSYLRMCVFRDDLSFRRIVNRPRRNIGKSRMEAVEKFAEEHAIPLYGALCRMADGNAEILNGTQARQFIALVEKFSRNPAGTPASEILSAVLNESGYEKMLRTEGSQTRLDNLAELKQAVHEFEISCGEECDAPYFLSHAALLSGLDAGGSKNAVKLMTVHTAKGLEFPHVFLCGMNEGIFPSRKVKDRAAMEEERRLCFVAVTRAQKSLFLTDSEGRNLDGSVRFPSRFIFDIDRRYLKYTTELSDAFTAAAKSFTLSLDKTMEARERAAGLKSGDRIRHSILGCGTILETCENDGTLLIQFDSLPTPRKLRAVAVTAAES